MVPKLMLEIIMTCLCRYRVVLMDQDVMHRIVQPSLLAKQPRYSLVWKLAFIPKQPDQVCLYRTDVLCHKSPPVTNPVLLWLGSVPPPKIDHGDLDVLPLCRLVPICVGLGSQRLCRWLRLPHVSVYPSRLI